MLKKVFRQYYLLNNYSTTIFISSHSKKDGFNLRERKQLFALITTLVVTAASHNLIKSSGGAVPC